MNLNGRLLYLGWFNTPWWLETDAGKIDIWPIVDKFFLSFNGKLANDNSGYDSYVLAADKHSDFTFKYVPGKYVLLKKVEGFGVSNVYAYLDHILCRLSGRMIEIEIENGKQIKFAADKSEQSFGIYCLEDSSSCEVPRGVEETVCKIGKSDCCIFLTVGSDGFSCLKFSGFMARMLLDRLAKGKIRARRIGNCVFLGRKEREVANVLQ